MTWRGQIKSGLIRLLEFYVSPVSTGMALLGARVGFGACCVLIVLPVQWSKLGNIVQ